MNRIWEYFPVQFVMAEAWQADPIIPITLDALTTQQFHDELQVLPDTCDICDHWSHDDKGKGEDDEDTEDHKGDEDEEDAEDDEGFCSLLGHFDGYFSGTI